MGSAAEVGMSIKDDIKALEKAMAEMPSMLTSSRHSLMSDPVSRAVAYQKLLLDWDFDFMKICSPDRIRRLLDALKDMSAAHEAAFEVAVRNVESEAERGDALKAQLSRACELLKAGLGVLECEGFDAEVAQINAFLKEVLT
jgi:hypothetical protein